METKTKKSRFVKGSDEAKEHMKMLRSKKGNGGKNTPPPPSPSSISSQQEEEPIIIDPIIQKLEKPKLKRNKKIIVDFI